MSLRAFHIIFIICAVLVLIAFGVWAMNHYNSHQATSYLWTSIGSFLSAAGLMVYDVYFVKKVKA